MEHVFKYFFDLPLLAQVSELSPLLPIVGALLGSRPFHRDLTIFFYYLIITFIITGWMTYLASHGTNNLWLIHLQTPMEFTFFMWLFARWQEDAFLKRFFQITIPVFVCVWAALVFFVEKIDQFSTYSKPTETILLIIASGYCLFQVNKEKVESLFRQPSFWISSGALIYFTGTVILFTVSNLLLRESEAELRTAWWVVIILNIIANLFYLAGFICHRLTRP
jgi:hypothetical protein